MSTGEETPWCQAVTRGCVVLGTDLKIPGDPSSEGEDWCKDKSCPSPQLLCIFLQHLGVLGALLQNPRWSLHPYSQYTVVFGLVCIVSVPGYRHSPPPLKPWWVPAGNGDDQISGSWMSSPRVTWWYRVCSHWAFTQSAPRGPRNPLWDFFMAGERVVCVPISHSSEG